MMTVEQFQQLVCAGMVILAAAAVGVTLLTMDNNQRFVAQKRKLWAAKLQWGPQGVYCYGARPRELYSALDQRIYGALGLVNEWLEFAGHQKSDWDLHLSLNQIRGLGVTRIVLHHGNHTSQKTALRLHVEAQGAWHVYTFTLDEAKDLIRQIQRRSQHPIPEEPTTKNQTTADDATLLTQDIYGEWHEERKGDLLIAPDRLVFGWQSLLPFAQIRRVAVLDRGGLNPFTRDLVRIDYESAEGHMQVMGFLLHKVDDWADLFYRYAGIPVEMVEGRKKKENV